jgi:hypothetical protein
MRQGALSSVEDSCPNHEDCGLDAQQFSSADADRARGETASLMVNVFAGLTAAGVGTGITLLVLGSRDGGAPKSGVQIAPSPNGAMARGVVRF